MANTNNAISILVEKQLPEIISTENPAFIDFLEAYYEYMEQSNTAWNTSATLGSGKATDRLSNLLNYADIDTTIDPFAQKLYQEFLSYFPQNTLSNKVYILKNVKDFYRSKGSTKSFNFLFRALFGQTPELVQPKDQIFRASSGNWFLEKSVRLQNITKDGVADTTLESFQLFTGGLIEGSTSHTQAVVERVQVSYQLGVKVNELFITLVRGTTFTNGETIVCTLPDGTVLSGTMFGEQVISVTVTSPGTGYHIGDFVKFDDQVNDPLGEGANAFISSVTTGGVVSVQPTPLAGAGFRPADLLTFSGGGGAGAAGNVLTTKADNTFHPNTILIYYETIAAYQNVTLGNTTYNFPNVSTPDPVVGGNIHTQISHALSQFSLNNLGPISGTLVTSQGSNYISLPTVDATGNTILKTIGSIGRIEVNGNAGANYNVGELIIFTGGPGILGIGANASITNTNSSGAITQITIQPNTGYPIGGMGYSITKPPAVSINTAAGHSANIQISSLLAQGIPSVNLTPTTSNIGGISTITVTSGGSGYNVAPTVNLTTTGDGTAQAVANIISGVFTYPGRFLDESSFPSGYNSILQDRDYYQTFAYVIKVRESIDNYAKAVRDFVHPAGTKMWGEYVFVSANNISSNINVSNTYIATSNIYTANAVSFNGSGHLVYNGAIANVVNSKKGTLSVWVNLQQPAPTLLTETQVVFSTQNVRNSNTTTFTVSLKSTQVDGSGDANSGTYYIRVKGLDSNGPVALDIRSNISDSGQFAMNNWVHILSSWDLNNSNTLLYVTNVASQNIITANNSTIAYSNAANIGIASYANGGFTFPGSISEFWFDDNTFLDISNVANRHKYISSDLAPISLGSSGSTPTGSSPLIYIKGNVATINTNSGTSNNFSMIGSIEASPTSPSDQE